MNIAKQLIGIEQDPYAPNIENSLMIYKNAQRETYDSLCNVATPAPTRTHNPIPHDTLINLTAKDIVSRDWVITGTTYATSNEQGNAHFVFELEHDIIPGVRMQIAGHNSHIKMRSAILYMQTHTAACTNMDAPYSIPLQRKHTSKILEQLPRLINIALNILDDAATDHKDRLMRYKDHTITDRAASHLMIQAMEKQITPPTYLPDIVNDWRVPELYEFEDSTIYSLYNCFTSAFKKSPADTPRRSQDLIELLDSYIS